MVKFPDPIFIHKFDVDNATGTFLSAEDVAGEESKYRKFISEEESLFEVKRERARTIRLCLYGIHSAEQIESLRDELLILDGEFLAKGSGLPQDA